MRVPAYCDFLEEHPGERIPETDKRSYVERFPIQERCVDGELPLRHTMIDESSGSTGTPFNWVRNERERKESHKVVSFFVRYCFGAGPKVVINAFSMGAWATGINMGVALQRNAVVKNTGPDVDKILGTLRFLGPNYRYLIVGYPPFIKHLIDEAKAREFDLSGYDLDTLVGGEGMTEGLRDYLWQAFDRVYSGYGVTDIELGLAGETPVSVAIRRLAREDEEVRRRLFDDDPRLPMVFQYNPLMHHVEANEAGELVFTINRSTLLSPRIRYNVHDEGGVARFDKMAATLRELGIEIESLGEGLPLPFLWVYGRRDATLSVMGANIYPEDLEEAVYAEPGLAARINSFCQELVETENCDVRPAFHFEILGEPDEALQVRLERSVTETLTRLNADYRHAALEHPDSLRPLIQLHRVGEGPFSANSGRIKHLRKVS